MTDLQDDLDAEAGYLPPEGEEWPGPDPCPLPADEDAANQMLRSMRALDRRLADVQAVVDAERLRLERFADERTRAILRRREYLEDAVARWARGVNAADPKRATINLPNGTVSIRKAQPKMEALADDATLDRIAKEHPGWVRYKPAAAKTPIKAATAPGRLLSTEEVIELYGYDEVGWTYNVHATLIAPERCSRCGQRVEAVAARPGLWEHVERPADGSPCRLAAGFAPPETSPEELPGLYWLLPRDPKTITVKAS